MQSSLTVHHVSMLETARAHRTMIKNTLILATALSVAWNGWSQDAALGESTPPWSWERSASAGLTLTSGNTETALASADLLFDGKAENASASFGVNAVYGTESSETTAQSLRGFSQYNRNFNEKLYGYLRADLLHDDIADVDFRLTLGPGVGYHSIDNETTQLSFELGGAVIYERLVNGSDTYGSVRLGQTFKHKINERARVWQTAELLPQIDQLDNFLLTVELGIETKITEKLSLRVVVQDRFDNEPAPGRESNDLKLISGISYSF